MQIQLTFNIFDDELTQIKSEYITLWGSPLDDSFSVSGKYEDNLFIISGDGQAFTDTRYIVLNPDSQSITVKKKFKGQEIIIIKDRDGFIDVGGQRFGGVEGIYIFKPYTLDLKKYDVYLNNNLITTITSNSPDGTITISGGADKNSGSLVIKYIGYKVQYSCDLSENEVWIQENFAQPFSIKDLEFTPTKFCRETRPFVLRDFQQGETAIYPDPIPSFNRGDTLPIPTNKIGVVNYATYFVTGVNNKCAPNEANIKVAGKWICSQVIKPVEVVVRCSKNSDCYVPIKPQCFGYFKGCQNNECIYDESIPDSPICKNEVVTIVKQIQEVEKRVVVPITSFNSFIFSQNTNRQSFDIGDLTFTASQPQFLCEIPTDTDFISAPKPRSECWKTTINYAQNKFDLKDTESTFIESDLIKVQYFAGGKLTNGKYAYPEDWNNYFIFTIDSSEALKLNVEDSSYVILNSNKEIKLNIFNNLPNGIGVIKIRQKIKAINQFLPDYSQEIKLNKVSNVITFKLNTANLGINQLEVQVFYKIKADSEVLIPSDKFILNYNVVDELPSVTKFVEVEKEKIVEVNKFIEKIPFYIYLILGVLIFTILILIFKSKKKKK